MSGSVRRFGSLVTTGAAIAAIAAAALVATAPGVGAGGNILGPVDPTIADGDPGSLRDVVENDAADGDTVVLESGATYDICGNLYIGNAITIDGNGATIRQTCEDRVIYVDDVTVTINGTTITGGNSDDGAGINVYNGGLVLVQSTVAGNDAGCEEGGGVRSESGSFLRIVQSTISGNSAYEDAGIDMDDGGELTMLNSTVSGNESVSDGAVSLEDDTTAAIVYSTIAANTSLASPSCDTSVTSENDGGDVSVAADGEPANLSLDFDEGARLSIFGTVIALPTGGPNCANDSGGDPPMTPTSAGYNFSDDGSCGFDTATDKPSGGNPGLGALAANGGPTLTHLPQAGSPLIDAIPVAACGNGNDLVQTVITDDQRGVTRPQGGGCEIGSVEVVAEAVVVTPTFTG